MYSRGKHIRGAFEFLWISLFVLSNVVAQSAWSDTTPQYDNSLYENCRKLTAVLAKDGQITFNTRYLRNIESRLEQALGEANSDEAINQIRVTQPTGGKKGEHRTAVETVIIDVALENREHKNFEAEVRAVQKRLRISQAEAKLLVFYYDLNGHFSGNLSKNARIILGEVQLERIKETAYHNTTSFASVVKRLLLGKPLRDKLWAQKFYAEVVAITLGKFGGPRSNESTKSWLLRNQARGRLTALMGALAEYHNLGNHGGVVQILPSPRAKYLNADGFLYRMDGNNVVITGLLESKSSGYQIEHGADAQGTSHLLNLLKYRDSISIAGVKVPTNRIFLQLKGKRIVNINEFVQKGQPGANFLRSHLTQEQFKKLFNELFENEFYQVVVPRNEDTGHILNVGFVMEGGKSKDEIRSEMARRLAERLRKNSNLIVPVSEIETAIRSIHQDRALEFPPPSSQAKSKSRLSQPTQTAESNGVAPTPTSPAGEYNHPSARISKWRVDEFFNITEENTVAGVAGIWFKPSGMKGKPYLTLLQLIQHTNPSAGAKKELRDLLGGENRAIGKLPDRANRRQNVLDALFLIVHLHNQWVRANYSERKQYLLNPDHVMGKAHQIQEMIRILQVCSPHYRRTR